MANPYYVQPGTVLPGFRTAMERSAMERQEAEQEAVLDDFSKNLATMEPTQFAQYIAENPELAKTFLVAEEAQRGMNKRQQVDRAWSIATAENVVPVLESVAREKLDRGQDASQTLALIQDATKGGNAARNAALATLAANDPQGLNAYMGAMGGGREDVPADIQAFEYLTEDLTDEEKAVAKRIKLGLTPRAVGSATQTIAEKGTVEDVAVTESTLSEAKETGKLIAQKKLKPEVESAVKDAVALSTAKAKTAELEKSNEAAWRVYDTAMKGLVAGLEGAKTGPEMAFIPAVTANQQIAEGAVAAMAPVLKQLFRASGEGIFTDKDQELLLDMVPTRKDLPETRVAKLANIDAIVRAKLNVPTTAGGQVTPSQTEQVQEEVQEGDVIENPQTGERMILRNGEWVPYNG